MAQPLQDRAPPFFLCLYGTDNKFVFDNVLTRWTFIKKSLSKCGISVVGISSDGDSRLLKAMKHETRLGIDVAVIRDRARDERIIRKFIDKAKLFAKLNSILQLILARNCETDC